MPEVDKCVLLIEDNTDDVDLALRAFRKSTIPHRVIVAHDGVEALEYLHGTGEYAGVVAELPFVVLLDLKLPRIDGLDVLRRIREHERTSLLPVVVLTSSGEECDLVRAYQYGANSYIRKPVDFSTFAEVVASIQTYWLVLNEAPPCCKNT